MFHMPTKQQAVKAERVTLRYKAHGTWQAVRVWNTAYYTPEELDLILVRHKTALRKEGRKGIEVLRWTPTVFNAAGE